MGKNRKPEDRWMPLRVYRGRSKYEFHPKKGGAIPLCSLDAKQSEVWAAYEKAAAKVELTVDELAKEYFSSRWFIRKRPGTQRQYQESWKMLAKVFTGVMATKVRPTHVRKWMDKRGQTSEVGANREYSVLYNIYAHALQHHADVQLNPCIGVKKFPEISRDRYIEDSEYYPVLANSKPIVQAAMEISYCCAARGQDVRRILISDLQEKGIFIQQRKTGKKQIKEWTPRLRDAVDTALEVRREMLERLKGVASLYLIVTTRAQPYTESGFKTLWQKNKQTIERKHGIKINGWTYHDIKAKAISDHDGDKQALSGHKSAQMVGVYDRKAQVSPTLVTDQRPLKA